MNKNIILMDGAVGTSLWAKADDKVPVWRYNIENPKIVSELHGEYIAAGSQIILANTFGANATTVGKTEYSVEQVVSAGIRLAKEAAAGTDVKVAFSTGPLTGLLEPYGDITEEDAEKYYREQFAAAMSEKPDIIYVQTFIDIEMMKIALSEAQKYDAQIFCSMSFEPVGKTMMGNSVKDMIEAIKPYRVDAVGLNCSLGPDTALPIIRSFKDYTDLPLIFKPNAGKSTVSHGVSESAFGKELFVKDILPAADFVTYIGGCCGSDPAYIKLLAEKLGK